ncbi:hypothetical protein [Amycolatopsis decaplanina]|uniref:Uncharacterized protein n=1 Tax=Amycolatopsis decaplanina DSM 44594 TaxID=1284240 RepID=M2YCG4_9PSEU|nr:hypothetical protein [Amycolatopsis decaplanina]EME52547.1 hypothetical protein H074_33609 [Amycolatopsis decaplanina DSM 44594]
MDTNLKTAEANLEFRAEEPANNTAADCTMSTGACAGTGSTPILCAACGSSASSSRP